MSSQPRDAVPPQLPYYLWDSLFANRAEVSRSYTFRCDASDEDGSSGQLT